MTRSLTGCAVAVAMVVLLASCGSPPAPEPEPAPASDINPVAAQRLSDGGELRIAVTNLGGTWNPLHAERPSRERDQLRRAFLPTLFDVDTAGVLSPDPDFLASVDVAPGPPGQVTWQLNEDAVWADGAPIVAEDAIATWRACNGERPEFRCASDLGFDQITDVSQGSSPKQVKVTYAGSTADWQRPWSHGLLRAASVKDPQTFNDGWASVRPEWTAGPFTPSGQEPAALFLDRSETWWGTPPRLSRISLSTVDAAGGAKGFGDHLLDVLPAEDPDTQADVREQPGGTIRMALSGAYRRLIFNTTAGPLSDPAVRRAIMLSIDPVAVGRAAFPDTGYQPLPMDSQFYGRHQGQWVDTAAQAGVRLDREEAQRVLDRAGWRPGPDGVRVKDGQPLVIRATRIAGLITSEVEAVELQRELSGVGISVQIEEASIEELADGSLLSGGNFGVVGITADTSPFPLDGLDARFGSGGEQNFSQLAMPEADRLIGELSAASDPAQRVELSRQLEAVLWEQAPSMPLYQLPQLVGARDLVANYGAPGQASVDWTAVGLIAG
ncbi:ABC transporter family substrate-binding protein [Naumannella huperziae]